MPTIRYEKHADLSILNDRPIAIIGYGSQGHAHALNLLDRGLDVRVGLRRDSASWSKAEESGLRVTTTAEAAAEAEIIMLLAPDTAQPAIYLEDIAPGLAPGNTLMFAHGFNIRFGGIEPPSDIDVSLIAPKSPGHRLRETFEQGGGVPALLAIEQDSTGNADATALAYAAAIGSGRAGIITTTFAEETETDLFGEQAVLCGGISSLVKAGFETLTEAGYQPEIAYFECLHELKLIVDLMHRGGLDYMRYSVSNTAEYGDYLSGDRLIGDDCKSTMKQILGEIQSGEFASKWMDENRRGRPEFLRRRAAEHEHSIERTGRDLRAMMPFVNPITLESREA